MRNKRSQKITVPLLDLHNLFTVPERYPTSGEFSGGELYEPGIDYVVKSLTGSRLAGRGHMVLELSTAEVSPALAGAAHRAIERYCRHRIHESKRALNELLWTGFKSLQIGILFLASCLVLAAAIARSNPAPGGVGDVLTQGLTIVGWVSLWRPVEVFLYEWWPFWREVRVYDYILRMDIAVQARS